MSKEEDMENPLPEMALEKKEDNSNHEKTTVLEEKKSDLEEDLLNHLAKSKAIFKSQQKDDPDLTFEEKLTIARAILHKSHCLFLSKFGHYLRQEHLKYFDNTRNEDYEVSYHINRLQRYFNNSTRQMDVKNRRYEALKTLVEKGEYFSESEMMKRNPLLYEQLVGQYMTEKQKKARDNIDTKNITFVNLLLESIERDGLKHRQKLQEEEEKNALEESDSDEETETDTPDQLNQTDEKNTQWGEAPELEDANADSDAPRQITKVPSSISMREQQLLKQEFVSNMYQSFLDGKDIDFDYSTVDDNEAYDNIDLRTQDEEEKYFDSESPETLAPVEDINQSESEDELDAYMRSLKERNATNTLSLDNLT